MKLLRFSLFAAAFAVCALVANAQPTIYNQPPETLAQISGGPSAPVNKPTYSATMTLDTTMQRGAIHQILGVNATSPTATLNAASGGQFGQLLITIISDTGGITLTYGTNFKSTGTVNPTNGKSIVVAFVSDGTFFREFSRSASAQ